VSAGEDGLDPRSDAVVDRWVDAAPKKLSERQRDVIRAAFSGAFAPKGGKT